MKIEENLKLSLLFDIYKNLLTQKQKEVLSDFLDNNISLTELAQINNKNHRWHELYNQNHKIKNVVPENQEVIYKSSTYMFGQEALKQAGNDELLKQKIIDAYMELGTDLTKTIE